MKGFTKKITLIIIVVAGCMIACSKQDHELGRMLDPSEIRFEVTQDLSVDPGGNTVILRNETPETIPIWNYGTGRSNRMVDTVRYAFQGEYEIRFSALTAGGVVDMDPVVIEVTEDNLEYVEDPLWIALSGGPGNEKTWILDIDAHYFDGPLFFYGTDNGWLEEGGLWDGGSTGCYVDGGDCWNWSPDYAGNTWLMEYGDYGTMTFSLKGGPFVTADHQMLPDRGVESGTYSLNTQDKTLTMTDATPLHDEGNEDCVGDWGAIRLFSLTEDAMQFGVLRRDACDGAAYLVYNYVSQDYIDSQEEAENE